MEKKKLLLVAVSVGVVLLIIIGIPLLIIAPRQNAASPLPASVSTAIEPDRFAAIDPYGGQRLSGTDVQPQALVNDTQVPAYENTFPPAAETSQVTTLTVPMPQTAAVPNEPVIRSPQPVVIKSVPARPPAAEKPAPVPAVKQPVAKQPPAKPAAAAKPAVDPGKAYNNYWVQTGAFSTKVNAEGVKESLAGKGIASIIDNRDIDGKTWYRVRVGPYMSESEAHYWLALVKSIDGFADSQIRQTQSVIR